MHRKFPRRQRRLRDSEQKPGRRAVRGAGSKEGAGEEDAEVSGRGRAAPRKEPRKYG